jgi:hypothetical protein
MGDTYFSKFPIISYANNQVRNISERVKILHTRLINPDSYYPIELGEDIRADVLAETLYQDSYLDWLLWVNNTTVDPYYGWHMSAPEFHSYIRDKYGSIEYAEQQILYYRTAWPTETSPKLSKTTYDNVIPKTWQKFFQAIYEEMSGKLLYYMQPYMDWRMNTNQLLQWQVSMTNANTVFANDHILQVTSGGNVIGQAQVVEANSSVVIAQHASGFTTTPNGLQDMFNTTLTATASNTIILSQNISLNEAVFWEPLTAYDYEDEINAGKRFVSVIDQSLAQQLTATIATLLGQR